MDDSRVWSFEESLWIGHAELYRHAIDDACLMVLPTPPFVLTGPEAIEAVTHTPRWSEVDFSQGQISRPEEGLIVAAYHVQASRDGEAYSAHCTTTYRRIGHEDWKVIQHQQTPPLATNG